MIVGIKTFIFLLNVAIANVFVHFVYLLNLLIGHGLLYIISEDIVFEAEQAYNSLFLQ